MASSTSSKSSAQRVRDYRERKRKQGLKLVQFWLPDTSSPEFKAEAHRQSLAVANTPHARDDQEFIDSITIKWWEDE
jgi:DNA-binding LacI/PurR family transcriptional regulator